MGSWLTRNRAWVYIAFYDEYVGRHINTSALATLCCLVPLYLYGIHVNRTAETCANHFLYNWQYFDKRSRLCHNMVMEHFEVHKEHLEDLIVDLEKYGPKIFADIPERREQDIITMDDLALIDEMSGLTLFLDNFLSSHDVPETVKERIRARIVRYSGDKPKEIAMNELRNKMFGDQR